MQRNIILALHGFLGQPADWNPVQKELESLSPNAWNWITPGLFSTEARQIQSFDSFCETLIETYQAALTGAQKKIFVGYSLGGRLGLHLLKKHSQHFDQFVFISTHPGLLTAKEKYLRQLSDTQWAQKIGSMDWFAFLNDWNSQAVLQGSAENRPRLEKDFNLSCLQESLNFWSLGAQDDLRLLIQKHQNKIIWAVGQQDLKFLQIAEELEQKKILLKFSRIFSNHRILLENPKALAELLHQLS